MFLVHLASLVIISGVFSISLSLLQLDVFAAFINHAAWLNISLIEILIDRFARIPGAFFECREFPVVWAYAATIAYLGILLYLPALCGKLKNNSKKTEA